MPALNILPPCNILLAVTSKPPGCVSCAKHVDMPANARYRAFRDDADVLAPEHRPLGMLVSSHPCNEPFGPLTEEVLSPTSTRVL